MLLYDETTDTYVDSEKVKEALAFFLMLYAPDDWQEILGDSLDA